MVEGVVVNVVVVVAMDVNLPWIPLTQVFLLLLLIFLMKNMLNFFSKRTLSASSLTTMTEIGLFTFTSVVVASKSLYYLIIV